MNERDTKFLGFARLLMRDLATEGYDEIGYRSGEATQRIIAQRAYDLAGFLFSFLPPLVRDYPNVEAVMRAIPDMDE